MADRVSTARSAAHATFTVERAFDAAVGRVFAAWEDVEARKRWAVPVGAEIAFTASDFRIGGRDVSRCGPAGDLRFFIETRYEDIVPNERIIITESVSSDGVLLSVSLMTVEFRATATGTRLTLTNQMVALDGSDITDGSKEGWAAVLGNLALYLAATEGVQGQ